MTTASDRSLAADPHGLTTLLGCLVRVEATVFRLRRVNPFTVSSSSKRQFMWLLKPAQIAHATIDHVWVQGYKANRNWKIGTKVVFTAKLGTYQDDDGPKFCVRSPIRTLT